MASLIVRMLKHKAVYWAPGATKRDGKPSFDAAPVEIRCRWVDQKREIRTPEGKTFVCRAVVYVDRSLDLRGFLKFGKLADLTSETLFENREVYEILMTKESPKHRKSEILRSVYL